MSDGSSGEKTELPSPKKLRDAREKGQVARSQEVTTTVSLMSVIAYLWVNWGGIQQKIIELLDVAKFSSSKTFDADILRLTYSVFLQSAAILTPILGVCIVAAIAANFAQFGFLFSFESLMPSLDRISPAAGFKRIFSMKQVVELIKSVLKIIFLSALLYYVLREAIGSYIYSLDCGMNCLINVTSAVMKKIFTYTALAFIIVAIADFIYQKHSHTQSLMMTKDEVKREYKESEGDPHIKGKRKQLAHELIMSDAGGATKKASALVVNPTHLAVAFIYQEGETPLPRVVAKGQNLNAHFLRAQAEEAGVPVFRNVRLARTLYAEVGVDEYIPEDLFDAVAEVLVWVSKNKETLYRGRLPHGVIDMDVGDHRTSPPHFGSGSAGDAGA
jgi:type III secretion protein U